MGTLYSSDDIAEKLGITRDRVVVLAKSRGLGNKVGRQWVFTSDDLRKMRTRTPGRRRTKSARRPRAK